MFGLDLDGMGGWMPSSVAGNRSKLLSPPVDLPKGELQRSFSCRISKVAR